MKIEVAVCTDRSFRTCMIITIFISRVVVVERMYACVGYSQ